MLLFCAKAKMMSVVTSQKKKENGKILTDKKISKYETLTACYIHPPSPISACIWHTFTQGKMGLQVNYEVTRVGGKSFLYNKNLKPKVSRVLIYLLVSTCLTLYNF